MMHKQSRPQSRLLSLPPLAELHCHLEGTVTPELALKLAERNGVCLADVVGDNGRYRWTTFLEFLAAYDGMTEAICTEQDLYDITYAYYADMAQRGLIYGEMFVSPQHGLNRGLSYTAQIGAIADAMYSAEAYHGVVARIIITCVRNYGAEHAEEMARLAIQNPHPLVSGFGMAGDEACGEPTDFIRAFKYAAEGGLGLTAHAGEVMGAESVRATLEALPIDRIGHGVRAIEDEGVLDLLMDRNIVMEVCPGSNIALGVYPDHQSHPLRRLMERGLSVTLNSDDPPFFDTTIEDEYKNAALFQDCTDAELAHITRSAIMAAFCDDRTKTVLLDRLRKHVKII